MRNYIFGAGLLLATGCLTVALIAEATVSVCRHEPLGIDRAPSEPSSTEPFAPSASMQDIGQTMGTLAEIRRRLGVNVLAGSSLDAANQNTSEQATGRYSFDDALADVLGGETDEAISSDDCESDYRRSILNDRRPAAGYVRAIRQAVRQLEIRAQSVDQLGNTGRAAELRELADRLHSELNTPLARRTEE